jgi:SprT-like family
MARKGRGRRTSASKKTQRRSYERAADQPVAITPVEYSGLQEAYDHFTRELFDGQLPDVFITYQRKANSYGYFSPDRFTGRLDKTGRHELALNPDGFVNQSDQQVCQTLNHEMTHVWQHAFGKPSACGYHNREWAAKMKTIGLQPSSTGMVGGKETGHRARRDRVRARAGCGLPGDDDALTRLSMRGLARDRREQVLAHAAAAMPIVVGNADRRPTGATAAVEHIAAAPSLHREVQ